MAGCAPDAPASPPDHTARLQTSIEAFQGRDRTAWRNAVGALVEAGPSVVPHLVPLLMHDNRGVREWVTHALGDLAPQIAPKHNTVVINALVAAMEDRDDYVVLKAARALGRIGPDAFSALPALRKFAMANLEALSATAEMAIQRIDPHPN